MAVREVTRENWTQRILESIKGIAVGFLIFVLAFPLLFWNEGRAVKTSRSLSEGAAAVVSIDHTRVTGAMEGKLVHLSGLATTGETLSDATFGVSAPAIKLRREVEMFQWKEHEKTETRQKTGGGEEQVTIYTYEKVWDDDLVSSSDFREGGHVNPTSMPYDTKVQTAQTVTVGAYTLSKGLVDKLDAWDDLVVTDEARELAAPAVQGRGTLVEGHWFLGENPATPQVGDLRVSFDVVRPTEVSVVARQNGARLEPYETQSGYPIELLEVGRLTDQEMFAAAESRNTTLTWILRGVGFAMMFVGLFLIGRPISVAADFIPAVGSLFRVGILLFSLLIALGASLLTIGIAWVFYRPVLGIVLLTVAALCFVLLIVAAFRVARRGRAEAEAPA